MRDLFEHPLLSFSGILLRGVGQVFFQNNPWTGLIIITGVAISSWTSAVDFLIGAAVATWVALPEVSSRSLIASGRWHLRKPSPRPSSTTPRTSQPCATSSTENAMPRESLPP